MPSAAQQSQALAAADSTLLPASDSKESTTAAVCGLCGSEVDEDDPDATVSPTISLECGHHYCEECLLNQLTAKWSMAHVSFGYLDCCFCRQQLKRVALPQNATSSRKQIDKCIADGLALKKSVASEAVNRLKADDPKLDGLRSAIYAALESKSLPMTSE